MARGYVPNPSFEREMAGEAGTRAVLREVARDIASDAESRGREVAPSYRAEVVDHGSAVRVEADTDGIDAASWIEFGTADLPATAPLRNAAQASGARLGD